MLFFSHVILKLCSRTDHPWKGLGYFFRALRAPKLGSWIKSIEFINNGCTEFRHCRIKPLFLQHHFCCVDRSCASNQATHNSAKKRHCTVGQNTLLIRYEKSLIGVEVGIFIQYNSNRYICISAKKIKRSVISNG